MLDPLLHFKIYFIYKLKFSFFSSPFTLSETEPVPEAGELVGRGSSTITSMSLLLSSAGREPGCSSLLREIYTNKSDFQLRIIKIENSQKQTLKC